MSSVREQLAEKLQDGKIRVSADPGDPSEVSYFAYVQSGDAAAKWMLSALDEIAGHRAEIARCRAVGPRCDREGGPCTCPDMADDDYAPTPVGADPELAAIAAIVTAMDRLDEEAPVLGTDVHERVIRWAMARWNVRD